jgi:hypothetical protein
MRGPLQLVRVKIWVFLGHLVHAAHVLVHEQTNSACS